MKTRILGLLLALVAMVCVPVQSQTPPNPEVIVIVDTLYLDTLYLVQECEAPPAVTNVHLSLYPSHNRWGSYYGSQYRYNRYRSFYWNDPWNDPYGGWGYYGWNSYGWNDYRPRYYQPTRYVYRQPTPPARARPMNGTPRGRRVAPPTRIRTAAPQLTSTRLRRNINSTPCVGCEPRVTPARPRPVRAAPRPANRQSLRVAPRPANRQTMRITPQRTQSRQAVRSSPRQTRQAVRRAPQRTPTRQPARVTRPTQRRPVARPAPRTSTRKPVRPTRRKP